MAVSFFRLPREAESPDGFSNGDGDDLFFFYEGEGARRVAVRRSPLSDERLSRSFLAARSRACGSRHLSKESSSSSAAACTFLASFATRSASSGWTRRTRTATSSGPSSRARARGRSASSSRRTTRFVERFPVASPFDVVGWDGTVWPFAFDILKYQPKTGLVHLPPTIHSTFGGRNALICSFVPRVTDTHPDAIPCPYPHTSVDCDEIIYYVRGSFTSRKGVGPKAVSLHPAGVPHGPHPGAYEGSIGSRSTDELAVMMDTFAPLRLTEQALALESPGYHDSWNAG